MYGVIMLPNARFSFQSDVVVQLSMGMETTFHLDSEKPSYAFKPCGHMASQRTVK